jgi:hypothetical protein
MTVLDRVARQFGLGQLGAQGGWLDYNAPR